MEARKSLLRHKKERLDQSDAAYSAILKKLCATSRELSVLKSMDDVDQTAFNALHDAQCRLCAECSKATRLNAELFTEFITESKQLLAYLDHRQADPPKLKPSQEIGSLEGDTFHFNLLTILTLFNA